MNNNILLAPPVAFLVVLAVALILSRVSSTFSAEGTPSPGKTKAYACGESAYSNRVRPDYAEFFPFAFFFTIMHVVALIVTTVPAGVYGLPLLYLLVAVLALLILFRG